MSWAILKAQQLLKAIQLVARARWFCLVLIEVNSKSGVVE